MGSSKTDLERRVMEPEDLGVTRTTMGCMEEVCVGGNST